MRCKYIRSCSLRTGNFSTTIKQEINRNFFCFMHITSLLLATAVITGEMREMYRWRETGLWLHFRSRLYSGCGTRWVCVWIWKRSWAYGLGCRSYRENTGWTIASAANDVDAAAAREIVSNENYKAGKLKLFFSFWQFINSMLDCFSLFFNLHSCFSAHDHERQLTCIRMDCINCWRIRRRRRRSDEWNETKRIEYKRIGSFLKKISCGNRRLRVDDDLSRIVYVILIIRRLHVHLRSNRNPSIQSTTNFERRRIEYDAGYILRKAFQVRMACKGWE